MPTFEHFKNLFPMAACLKWRRNTRVSFLTVVVIIASYLYLIAISLVWVLIGQLLKQQPHTDLPGEEIGIKELLSQQNH